MLDQAQLTSLISAPFVTLLARACAARDEAFGLVQTCSPKVFLPLTQLCRDLCHYCTFSRPQPGKRAYMTPDEVLAVARAGAAAGCTEALFTLGDKPKERFAQARSELSQDSD